MADKLMMTLRGGLFDDLARNSRMIIKRIKGDATVEVDWVGFGLSVTAVAAAGLGMDLILRGFGLQNSAVRAVGGIVALGFGDALIAEFAESRTAIIEGEAETTRDIGKGDPPSNPEMASKPGPTVAKPGTIAPTATDGSSPTTAASEGPDKALKPFDPTDPVAGAEMVAK